MKGIRTYTEDIPGYALGYLINDDPTNLEDEDINNINCYMEQFNNEAKELNGYVVIDVISEDPIFTHSPAFGLACDCFECNINIIY